jgi:hypothetical protein
MALRTRRNTYAGSRLQLEPHFLYCWDRNHFHLLVRICTQTGSGYYPNKLMGSGCKPEPAGNPVRRESAGKLSQIKKIINTIQ